MKFVYSFVVFLLFAQCLEAQVQRDSIFKVIHFDSSATFDVTGTYITSNGFCGYKFILDSNQSFRKIGFSCAGQERWDSGRWSFENNTTLTLTGSKTTTHTTIIKLGTYYYLVPESEKQKLVNDYLETKTRFKWTKPITIDGQTFSVEYKLGTTCWKSIILKNLCLTLPAHNTGGCHSG